MSAASVPDTCAVARRLSQRSRSSVSMAPSSLRRSFRQRACASCRSVATGGTSAATAGSMRTWSSRGFRAEWSARTGGRGGSSCGSSPGRGCPSPTAPSTPSTRSTCSSTSCRGTARPSSRRRTACCARAASSESRRPTWTSTCGATSTARPTPSCRSTRGASHRWAGWASPPRQRLSSTTSFATTSTDGSTTSTRCGGRPHSPASPLPPSAARAGWATTCPPSSSRRSRRPRRRGPRGIRRAAARTRPAAGWSRRCVRARASTSAS
mmetsp:Transcript_6468/g.20628  ORF Transcript_6468/g.20628 Transcript_6468/m.20628 type:complete len:267 (+) Transcript_6468:244-1044(+)